MSSLCTVALVGIAACEVGMLVTRGSLGRGMGGCWLPLWPHRLLSYGSQGGVPEGCGLGTPPMSFALAQEGFLWVVNLPTSGTRQGIYRMDLYRSGFGGSVHPANLLLK